jgi:hypothetical protein
MLKGGGRRAFTASWMLECPGYVVEGAAPGLATRGFCQASDTDPRRLSFIATDPFILIQVEAQLGRHVRNLYPVDPGWLVRGSAFDMDAFLTRNFETAMVTYENGDSWEKKMKAVGCIDQRNTTRTLAATTRSEKICGCLVRA